MRWTVGEKTCRAVITMRETATTVVGRIIMPTGRHNDAKTSHAGIVLGTQASTKVLTVANMHQLIQPCPVEAATVVASAVNPMSVAANI